MPETDTHEESAVFRPTNPYEAHYSEYRTWSVHASPKVIARVAELGRILGRGRRRRVTHGEVLELALAALDRELEEASDPGPEMTPQEMTRAGDAAHRDALEKLERSRLDGDGNQPAADA